MKLSRGYQNDLPLHLVAGLDGEAETALSHPLRREILRRLNSDPNKGESPSTLAKSIPCSPAISTVSYHAKVLVECETAESENDLTDSPSDLLYRTLVSRDATIRDVLDQMSARDAAFSGQSGGFKEDNP